MSIAREIKLTEKEQTFIKSACDNEYGDVRDGDTPWTWAVIDDSGMNSKVARGVISSLVKKGIITCDDYDDEVFKDSSCVSKTDESHIIWDGNDELTVTVKLSVWQKAYEEFGESIISDGLEKYYLGTKAWCEKFLKVNSDGERDQGYVISYCPKSVSRGPVKAGYRLFSRREADEIIFNLNARYPTLNHFPTWTTTSIEKGRLERLSTTS